jgi:hypothetical protein
MTYISIDAGQMHNLAMRSDRTLVAFGWNGDGQCNVPALDPGVTYIDFSASGQNSVALRSNGSVVVWGSSSFGQLDVPTLPIGLAYVGVAAGGNHVLARRSDGALLAWGENDNGECDVPALPTGEIFVEVDAGAFFSLGRHEPFFTPASVYCSGKLNSLGCTPSIGLVGIPSASFGKGCTLTTINVAAKNNGIYFHGTLGSQALPFHGGFLCVMSPLRHHTLLDSGGTSGTCNGTFAEDLNVYIGGGFDPALVAGASVWIQNWSRDPADPFTDSLSDAVMATIAP